MSHSDERLEFVAELTLLGFNPNKIAERLGVTESVIRKDLEKIRMRWQDNRKKTYTEFIDEELATQKMLMSSLEEGIRMGSWKHVETALKITERRAATMGLDHVNRMDQARVEIESRQLDMISNALNRVMDVLELSEDQRALATETLILQLEEPVITLEEEELDD